MNLENENEAFGIRSFRFVKSVLQLLFRIIRSRIKIGNNQNEMLEQTRFISIKPLVFIDVLRGGLAGPIVNMLCGNAGMI